uniref:Uncharacterized protein n=1 Tax=Caenorhabditis japonica TaxID=281687 RepID=A0A8R1DGG4_CAEJA
MSDDSEKVSAYSRRSLKPKAERHVVRGHAEALRALDGLTDEEKAKKSEDMLRKLWKYPHPSWSKITEITKVQTEKTSIEGQVCEDVKREVKHDVDKKIYDVPMDNCHLRLARNRTLRSCPDPWRRYGAHVKLCQV